MHDSDQFIADNVPAGTDSSRQTPSEIIAQSLVGDISALVSPPDVYVKLNALIADQSATIDEVAAVMLRDTSLTFKVLQLANSSVYGQGSKVDTVSRAVTIVGLMEVQKMVCTISAVRTFSKLSSQLTNMNAFWRHGVYVGLMAQTIARRANILHPERLFVAGVLHDVGALIINHRFPELAGTIIAEVKGSEDRLSQLETERLGFDHAYLGGLMLQSWHLPTTLCEAVRLHHLPHCAQLAGLDATILKVADTIANFSGTGSFSEIVALEDPENVSRLAQFGVHLNCTNDELMDEIDQQFVETIYLLVG